MILRCSHTTGAIKTCHEFHMRPQHIAAASAAPVKKAYPAWQIQISERVNSGEEFYVDLLLENPNAVNALEGVIEYDRLKVTPTLVDYSDSAGKLWPRPENKPYQVGEIDFIAIIPGPIATKSADTLIMRVYFKALTSGESQIKVTRGRVGLQTVPGHTVTVPTKILNFKIAESLTAQTEKKLVPPTHIQKNSNMWAYVLGGVLLCAIIVTLVVRKIKAK